MHFKLLKNITSYLNEKKIEGGYWHPQANLFNGEEKKLKKIFKITE